LDPVGQGYPPRAVGRAQQGGLLSLRRAVVDRGVGEGGAVGLGEDELDSKRTVAEERP
jgi:hypothetical protein